MGIGSRHHVVQPVDADLPPALVGSPITKPGAGRIDEHLLVDPGLLVLAHVAGLDREDDRWVALERQEHVRVAVDDDEAGHVPNGALEAAVLAPGDDHGVEAVAREGLAHVRVAALDVRWGHVCAHDASSPLIRAVTASFKGVGTPSSRPKRAMPPFR